jgi:hypothetical protein
MGQRYQRQLSEWFRNGFETINRFAVRATIPYLDQHSIKVYAVAVAEQIGPQTKANIAIYDVCALA